MSLEIPGYTIQRRIGRGGMASVYLAVQQSLERPVALKVLDRSVADTPEFTERFLSEGRVIAQLQHRNIITIHDIGCAQGLHYISMEHVDGGDLKRRIAEGIDPDTALSLMETIGACLDFAHRAGVVHRDVTPANILFRRDGTPVLTDFGIAKATHSKSELTRTGTVLGTPAYLSPERAQGKAVDGRADIYSLGVILYEMLVGTKPYDGDSDIETIFKHLQEPIPKLPRHLARFQPLLDRMIAKRPEGRFRDAATLVREVRRLRAGGRMPGPRTRRWLGAALATVCLGVAGSLLALGPPPWLAALSPVGSSKAPSPAQPAAAPTGDPGTPPPAGEPHAGGASPGPPLPAAEAPGDTDVERLLAQADRALAERRLSRPAGDNALFYYRAVLAVDPDNWRARRGVGRVAGGHARRAERAMEAGRHEEARRQLELGLQAVPDAPELRELQEELARRRQLDELLRRAEQALADYRLTTPPEDNAHYYYRRALELDPDNAGARRGLESIAERYAWLAEDRIAKLHYGEARRYIQRGLRVDPDNSRLLALRREAHIKNAPRHLLDNVKGLFD